MRMLSLKAVGAVPAAVMVLALGACNWQVPESANIKGSPGVAVPTGDTVFELDEFFDLDEIVEDFQEAVDDKSDFQSGEPEDDDELIRGDFYDGTPFVMFSELTIEADFDLPDIPDGELPEGVDFEESFDGETDEIDLSDIFGPLPEEAEIDDVPGRLSVKFNDNPAEIEVRLRVLWDDQEEYLIGDEDGFESITFGDPPEVFELTDAFNARPDDLIFEYEFGADTDSAGKVDNFELRIEVPFKFTAPDNTFLDFDDDDDDDDPFVFDEDIFGRDADDPDEDLNDFIDSLKGSSAELFFVIENTAGFTPILRFVDSTDPAEKADREVFFETEVEETPDGKEEISGPVTSEQFDKMVEAEEFLGELLILMPKDFQINRDGEFRIESGYLRADAAIDYTFDFD